MRLTDHNPSGIHHHFIPGKLALAIALAVHGSVSANTIYVDAALFGEPVEVVDDGFCSLKEAILNANTDGDSAGDKDCEAGFGPDIIVLPGDLSQAYTFTVSGSNYAPPNTGLPEITDDLVIRGSTLAPSMSTIQRNPANGTPEFRLFKVTHDAELTLENLQLRDGKLATAKGGAILLENGTVTLKNSAISYNETGGRGGAIHAFNGAVNCESSNLSDNFGSSGGAINASYSTVSLEDCTISSNGALSANGGGIALDYSAATIRSSALYDNASLYDGGAIHAINNSTVSLSNSTVRDNLVVHASAKGGGIAMSSSANPSSVSLANSTVSNNTAALVSAISIEYGYFMMDRSTISGNIASSGDTLRLRLSEAWIRNSTVSGNTASGDAIAVLDQYASLNMTNVTITRNSNGNKTLTTFNPPSDITMRNVIMAGNSSAFGNCGLAFGTGVNQNNNWYDDLSCNGTSNGDPKLGPLDDNGGPTLSHALLKGSGAIDAGDDTACAEIKNIDQRGQSRSGEGAHCDIGAYEVTGKTGFFTIPLKNGKTVIFGL